MPKGVTQRLRVNGSSFCLNNGCSGEFFSFFSSVKPITVFNNRSFVLIKKPVFVTETNSVRKIYLPFFDMVIFIYFFFFFLLHVYSLLSLKIQPKQSQINRITSFIYRFLFLHTWMYHGDKINRSNNSVSRLRKSIEIGKLLISSAPREFE